MIIKDFESGSRYETLLALCHLPKRDTRDHARRSWHIFSQLIRLESGEKMKGTNTVKVLAQVKAELLEGFRVVRRNRRLTDVQLDEVKTFVTAVTDAVGSDDLLRVIGAATVWFRTLE